jgi:adenosine deaminase
MNIKYPEKLAEFHVHLEGCVWNEHIKSWWSRSEYLFPSPSPIFNKKFDFANFLEHLRFGYNFLNSEEAYASVANLYATTAAQNGVCYSELQINYALVKTWGLDLELTLKKINEFCQAIPLAPTLRFIVDLPWQFDAYSLINVINNADKLWELGVRGISMGGDENLAKPKEVKKIFEHARSSGLKVLCHAGETTSYDVAKNIVETLEPDRIAHGISISNWITSLGHRSPPIDVCLSSNLALGVITSLEDHPLKNWHNTGVPLSLSTDDPAIFNSNIHKEYDLSFQICPELLEDEKQLHALYLKCALDRDALSSALKSKEPPTH